MRLIVPFSTLLLGCATTPAAPPEAGCFERHLLEAIELNTERRPRYAARTDDRSLPISNRLLAAERALLPVAWAFDSLDRNARAVGVCEMFEPMSAARDFGAGAPPHASFVPVDARGIERELRGALKRGYADVSSSTAARLEALEGQPGHHCMLRHLLESTRRAANVADRHEREAVARRLPSRARLYKALLNLHLSGLVGASEIDAEAAPLQADGVAIVCDDVPSIPPWPQGE
jgi:hypothetical protein